MSLWAHTKSKICVFLLLKNKNKNNMIWSINLFHSIFFQNMDKYTYTLINKNCMNMCWSYIHIWEIGQIRNTQIRNTNKKSWEFLNIIHVTDKKRPFYSLQDVFKGFPIPGIPFFNHFVILLLYYFKTYYSIVVEDLFWFHQGTDILVPKCKYCHIPKLSINYKN